jgi:ribosomal protein L37E
VLAFFLTVTKDSDTLEEERLTSHRFPWSLDSIASGSRCGKAEHHRRKDKVEHCGSPHGEAESRRQEGAGDKICPSKRMPR